MNNNINEINNKWKEIQYHFNRIVYESYWLNTSYSIKQSIEDKNKLHEIKQTINEINNKTDATIQILIECLLDRILQREQRINYIIESTTISLNYLISLQETLSLFLQEQKEKERQIIATRHEILDVLENVITSKNINDNETIEHEQKEYILSLDIFRKQTEYRITLHRECILTEFDHMDWLEESTGLSLGEILFDSNYDDWSTRSVMITRISNKHDLLFLIEDTDGEVFGGYLHEQIKEKFDEWITDNKSFLFNLKSNGRLSNPTKFEIKQSHRAFYFHPESNPELLFLGCHGSLCVYIKELKDQSICDQYESAYQYHGIENAVCGKEEFIPKRITVIQMK